MTSKNVCSPVIETLHRQIDSPSASRSPLQSASNVKWSEISPYGVTFILRYWCQAWLKSWWLIYGPVHTFRPINNNTQLPVTMDVMRRNGRRLRRGKLKVTSGSVSAWGTRERRCRTIRNFRPTKAERMTSFVQPFQMKWMLPMLMHIWTRWSAASADINEGYNDVCYS